MGGNGGQTKKKKKDSGVCWLKIPSAKAVTSLLKEEGRIYWTVN